MEQRAVRVQIRLVVVRAHLAHGVDACEHVAALRKFRKPCVEDAEGMLRKLQHIRNAARMRLLARSPIGNHVQVAVGEVTTGGQPDVALAQVY